jgi:hypothetical protein
MNGMKIVQKINFLEITGRAKPATIMVKSLLGIGILDSERGCHRKKIHSWEAWCISLSGYFYPATS